MFVDEVTIQVVILRGFCEVVRSICFYSSFVLYNISLSFFGSIFFKFNFSVISPPGECMTQPITSNISILRCVGEITSCA